MSLGWWWVSKWVDIGPTPPYSQTSGNNDGTNRPCRGDFKCSRNSDTQRPSRIPDRTIHRQKTTKIPSPKKGPNCAYLSYLGKPSNQPSDCRKHGQPLPSALNPSPSRKHFKRLSKHAKHRNPTRHARLDVHDSAGHWTRRMPSRIANVHVYSTCRFPWVCASFPTIEETVEWTWPAYTTLP